MTRVCNMVTPGQPVSRLEVARCIEKSQPPWWRLGMNESWCRVRLTTKTTTTTRADGHPIPFLSRVAVAPEDDFRVTFY